jgi:hypothetical protein
MRFFVEEREIMPLHKIKNDFENRGYSDIKEIKRP